MRTGSPQAYEELSVWRDLEGVGPGSVTWNPDGPNPTIPRDATINARLEGPWGLPWIEGLEDPNASSGMVSPSPNPQIDQPDVGWKMGPGDYEGAFRTRGPIQAWGHEVSGGLWGDQALGRTMRFPANIPDRYDANGVWVGDYHDLLAATLQANEVPMFADEIGGIEALVQWTGNTSTFTGWEG